MATGANPPRSRLAQAGLFLGGRAAAAEIASRPGELNPADVAHLRKVLQAHLRRVQKADLQALHRPEPMGATPAGPPPAHAPRWRFRRSRRGSAAAAPDRAPSRRRASGRSRRKPGVRDLVLLVFALLLVAGAAGVGRKHHSPSAIPAVRHVQAIRHGAEIVISFTARAGSRVRIFTASGRSRRVVTLRATGQRQSWIGRTHAKRRTRVRVTACVARSAHQWHSRHV